MGISKGFHKGKVKGTKKEPISMDQEIKWVTSRDSQCSNLVQQAHQVIHKGQLRDKDLVLGSSKYLSNRGQTTGQYMVLTVDQE